MFERCRGAEEVVSRYDFKKRNVDGQREVDFANRMKLAAVTSS